MELVAQGRDDLLECLGQDDVAHRLPPTHTETAACLHLAFVDGLDAAAEDFRHIGAAVDGAGRNGGEEGVYMAARQSRQGEVDDEDLYQQRGAADKVDVHVAEPPQRFDAGQADQGDDDADDHAEEDGQGRDFQRDAGAGQQKGQGSP